MSKKEKEKLVPNLRFKGFTDDWIQRILLDMLDKKDGIRRGPFGSALKKDYFVPYSNYVVYEQRNAIDDHYETRYNITKEKFDELHRFVISPGDFILSGAGTIGRISRAPDNIKPGVFNQALIRLKLNLKLTDPEFFMHWMRSDNLQRRLTQANPASAMANLIPMSELKKWKVIVPPLEEQRKLGELISQLDNIITLEQEKLAQFKLIYDAFIKRILISVNPNGPDIRLQKHRHDWKQYKISDIFKITRGNVLAKTKVSNKKDGKNIYPVFSSQTLENGLMGYYDKYLFENAITWTTDGANAGTVTYRRGKFYSTNVNGVLLSEDGYASEIVAIILNSTAHKHVSHVGNPKLMNNIMAEIKVYLPTDMNELEQLNLLFVEVKNIIFKMEHSLLKYENIKKILLNNLFV